MAYQVWKSDDGKKEGTKTEVDEYEASLSPSKIMKLPWKPMPEYGSGPYDYTRDSVLLSRFEAALQFINKIVPQLENLDKLSLGDIYRKRDWSGGGYTDWQIQVAEILKTYDKLKEGVK